MLLFIQWFWIFMPPVRFQEFLYLFPGYLYCIFSCFCSDDFRRLTNSVLTADLSILYRLRKARRPVAGYSSFLIGIISPSSRVFQKSDGHVIFMSLDVDFYVLWLSSVFYARTLFSRIPVPIIIRLFVNSSVVESFFVNSSRRIVFFVNSSAAVSSFFVNSSAAVLSFWQFLCCRIAFLSIRLLPDRLFVNSSIAWSSV